MEDTPQIDAQGESGTTPQPAGAPALSRRDFLKLAALLSGSTLLLLSRSGQGTGLPPAEGQLPPIPPDFKRFLLISSAVVADEQVWNVLAYGSQCPDLRCALLWANDPNFQFYDSVEDIVNLYTASGNMELYWLD